MALRAIETWWVTERDGVPYHSHSKSVLLRYGEWTQQGLEAASKNKAHSRGCNASRLVMCEVKLPVHVHHLSSVGNAFVKHVVRLRQSSSYRHACGSLVVVGDVPLREICDIAPAKLGRKAFIKYLFVLESSNARADIAEFAERVVWVTSAVMHKLSGVESAEGFNAVGITPFPRSFCSLDSSEDFLSALKKWCPCPQRLLVLDGIQDPGNLGTLLRTAAAFDWDGIFLLNGCCDPFNEKALRASRGACFWIPIACGQWRQLQVFTTLKKIKLYAGEPKSKINMVPLKQGLLELSSHPKYLVCSGRENEEEKQSSTPTPVHLQKVHTLANITGEESMCLILGSEGQGLSEDVRAACSLFSISMPGRFESLNVAVAGGILLYMLQKQKRKT